MRHRLRGTPELSEIVCGKCAPRGTGKNGSEFFSSRCHAERSEDLGFACDDDTDDIGENLDSWLRPG